MTYDRYLVIDPTGLNFIPYIACCEPFKVGIVYMMEGGHLTEIMYGPNVHMGAHASSGRLG